MLEQFLTTKQKTKEKEKVSRTARMHARTHTNNNAVTCLSSRTVQ